MAYGLPARDGREQSPIQVVTGRSVD